MRLLKCPLSSTKMCLPMHWSSCASLPANSITLVTVLDCRGKLKPRGSIQNIELSICWIVTGYSEYCWLLIMFICRKSYSHINLKYHVLKLNTYSFLVIPRETFRYLPQSSSLSHRNLQVTEWHRAFDEVFSHEERILICWFQVLIKRWRRQPFNKQ